MEDTQKILDLESRIEYLESFIQDLQVSSSLPREVETALRQRIKFVAGGAAGAAATQTIALTGNAQNITVPAQPSGVVAITIQGTTYNVYYA